MAIDANLIDQDTVSGEDPCFAEIPAVPLELTFAIEPDEHGVVDGRLLAQQLIAVAFRALVPYVNGCHACADNIFGLIANEVLADLHDKGHATGQLDGDIWQPVGEDHAAAMRHLAAAEDLTRALFERAEIKPHVH